MKLHCIEVFNINSLYGRQVVDLDEGLRGAPLFLVVGPTGAGKSTLLDAVCLAFFGRTPRLSNKKGDPAYDHRRVMSYGTGEAQSRVVFSKLENGVRRRYRASWSCHRANRRPDGRLQTPERSLESWDTSGSRWKVEVSHRQTKVFKPVFDKVLEGMRVEEFNRAILLAQGQFSAFLKADEDGRAAILELLTNTAEYRELGSRASLRRKTAEDRVGTLQDQLEATSVLSPEERERLGEVVRLHEEEQQQLEARLVLLSELSDWLARKQSVAGRSVEAERALATAKEEVDAASSALAGLEEHERCVPAGSLLADLRAAEARVGTERERVGKLAEGLLGKTAEREALQQRVDAARGVLAQALEESEQLKPKLDQAVQLQAEIDALNRDRERSSARVNEGSRATGARRQEQAQRAEELAAGQREEASTTARQSELGDGAALRSALSGITERVQALVGEQGGLDQRRQGIESDRDRRGQLAERLEEGRKSRGLVEAEVAAARAVAGDAAAQLSRFLGEAESLAAAQVALSSSSEAARAKQRHLDWILGMAEERDRLEEGKPCPLCGSEVHSDEPEEHAQHLAATREQMAGVQAELDQLEVRGRALGDQQKGLEAAERSVLESEARLAPLRVAVERDESQLRETDEDLLVRQRALDESRTGWARKEQELVAQLEQLAVPIPRGSAGPDLQAAATAAAQRLTLWERQEAALGRLRERLEALRAEHEAGRKLLEVAVDQEATARQELTLLVERHDDRSRSLRAFFGDRNPLEVRAESEERLTGLRAALATQEEAAARSGREHAALEAKAGETAARLQTEEESAQGIGEQLAAALSGLALGTVEELASRLLKPEELERRVEQRTRLNRALAEASAVREELAAQLAQLEAERPASAEGGELDREAALEWQTHLGARVQEVRDVLAATRAQLGQDDQLLERVRGLRDGLAVARREEALWGRLHRLIGVNSGGAFQRFAQILNLGELLVGANTHLARLTDRYQLTPALDEDGRPRLAFAVVDHYQGGLARPITTLSGGETFLVSLALALALGQFRSVRMPIETLLLDEGFGTLDRESQNVAMDALDRLQASGIQVGIISHVEGLKDRVPAQVRVEKQGDGRSLVEVVA